MILLLQKMSLLWRGEGENPPSPPVQRRSGCPMHDLLYYINVNCRRMHTLPDFISSRAWTAGSLKFAHLTCQVAAGGDNRSNNRLHV